MASKTIKAGGALQAQCPACKLTHAFKCGGTRSRASYHKLHKNGDAGKKDGQLMGWCGVDCKSPEAKEGKLYMEFPEPKTQTPDEEFPL